MSRPKVTGGLFFNLSYKEFSMHVNTSFVFKRDIINSVLAKSFKAYDDPVRKSIESLRKDASLSPIEKYNFLDRKQPLQCDLSQSRTTIITIR